MSISEKLLIQSQIQKQQHKNEKLQQQIEQLENELRIQKNIRHQDSAAQIAKVHKDRIDVLTQAINKQNALNVQGRIEVDIIRTNLKKHNMMLSDFQQQLAEKTEDMMTVSRILRSSSVERERAQKDLSGITGQEEKDRLLIQKDIEEIQQKIEREKLIKGFIRQKLRVQDQLQEVYNKVRQEEEAKVHEIEQKNLKYQNDQRATILDDKNFKTCFQAIIGLLRELKFDESELEQIQKTESFYEPIKMFVEEFVKTVESTTDLTDYLQEQENEIEQLASKIQKKQAVIRSFTDMGLQENNERLKLQMELVKIVWETEEQYQKNLSELHQTQKQLQNVKGQILGLFEAVQQPETLAQVKQMSSQRENTLQNTLEYLAIIETMLNREFTNYGKTVLLKLKQMKDIEDSEQRAYALQNITTLIPERHCHKFNVKEELSRMEEALNLGYADQEREQPIDLRVLYKIFSSKKVIKSGLNVSGGIEHGASEDDKKIVTNPQLAVKLFNKNKAYKESEDSVKKVERQSDDSSGGELDGKTPALQRMHRKLSQPDLKQSDKKALKGKK